jgi:hypothetical protein
MGAARAQAKTNNLASTTGHLSAMALDLALESEPVAQEISKNSNEFVEAEENEEVTSERMDDADDMIEGEELAAQHWFSLTDFEAQVKSLRQEAQMKSLRQEAEVVKPSCGPVSQDIQFELAYAFGIEEASADGDDADESFLSCPRRVRPGEHLMDPEESADHVDTELADFTDEDLAAFTAENAVDSGFFDFLAEADDFDMFGEEEEV